MFHRTPRTAVAAFAVLGLVVAGCASSTKLAHRSHEQLAEGEVRKAYQTALKAVEKDPYNEEAQLALRVTSDAVVSHEARRFRSLAAVDTMAAAEVSLDLEQVRRRAATWGVTLTSNAPLEAEERLVRARAAARAAEDGEALLAADRPKEAWAAFGRARRYDARDPLLVDRQEEARVRGTDRVLLLPYACDTRARIDARDLSYAMFQDVSRYAAAHCTFTVLAEPGAFWGRIFGAGLGGWTREAAWRIGEEEEATRVAFARVHGDRVERHSEVFETSLFRRLERRLPDGTRQTTWAEVPVRVRITDLWASVALDCEVHDLVGERIVARRSSDRGAGLRAVDVAGSLPGDPDDYVLYTPAMKTADRADCRARDERWAAALADLTPSDLVRAARDRSGGVAHARPGGHGTVRRNQRAYRVGYGRAPVEGALLTAALEDAWREVALALEEADRI